MKRTQFDIRAKTAILPNTEKVSSDSQLLRATQ